MKKKISKFFEDKIEIKSHSSEIQHEDLKVLEDFSYNMSDMLKNFEITVKNIKITSKLDEWFYIVLNTDEIYTNPVETTRQKGNLIEWKDEYKM